ncbi:MULTISPECIES: TonB-dependent receptor [unclassified Pseudoalteromonas]|uniref:TonB-dependent receptor n=1 Tax=unclassified Pseudoalteromonas TaxID=194690 RepID=UPI001B3A1384|nr:MULTISPECIES: TonB-dependent receptor [unclassified Pseudoalteromonas]MBQ4844676.1 TonB-dependent receptor [Pseudoalteromonas sp. MMG005]MBQ4850874.1 TonB-dependent receptor [Pseudoalteromonas sp. MMG012]
MLTNKKNKLTLIISSLLMTSTAGVSSFAHATGAKTDEVEVIQVRGIRGSVVKSINTKRYANSIVDAVTSEDIGKFPDQNVAESLQRITGVSMSRNFGEGERISIRGTSENQNRTLLNGQAVGSADWWVDSSASRGFNYTMLPSEIVSGLEVYKSPEADIDEGSIGGTVIVRTRKPLDLDANKIAGSVLMQHSEISGETDPQVAGLYSWKDSEEKFGALISVFRQERNLRRDGIEAWSWSHRDITLEDGTEINNVYTPGGGGSAMFTQERIRTGFNLTLQYRPSDNTDITFNALDSTMEANNANQNFLWLPGYGNSQYTSLDVVEHDKVGKFAQAGTMGLSPDGNNILDETKIRNSKLKTKSYDLKLDHEGELWSSSYHIGVTEGSGGTQTDRSVGWEGNAVHSFNASQKESIGTSYANDPADGSKWDLGFLRYDSNDALDKEYYLQTDFERPVDLAVFSKIKIGAKYRDHKRENVRLRSQTRTDLNWSLADYSFASPSDFLSGIGTNDTLRNYAMTDLTTTRAAGDALDWQYGLLHDSNFAIKEEILAGYIKADIDVEGMRGNLGVRLVETQQTTGAYVGPADAKVWKEEDTSYFDILPSINLAIDLDEDMLLRFGAARVMTRPDYAAMTNATTYNTETRVGTGGNSKIDPYRATQFDIGYEWYFSEAGIFSAAIFYKDLQSTLGNNTQTEIFDGVPIEISRPINGPSGTLQGLELGFQTELSEGFGISANYTYVDGESKDVDGNDILIPGISESTFNFSTYYETETYSGRISYNYRTGYDTGRAWPGYQDAYGQIDATLSYNVTENITAVFEAVNLTDEHTFSYQEEGVEHALTGVYADGRRFVAGIRFNF